MLIYANLQHGVQMFLQISRIPDLIRKFWEKRCGLYAGVYGTSKICNKSLFRIFSNNYHQCCLAFLSTCRCGLPDKFSPILATQKQVTALWPIRVSMNELSTKFDLQLTSIWTMINCKRDKATEYSILHDYQHQTVELYLSGRDLFISA